ncbi:MAG: hypothetical protein DME66_07885 [Verrucomicrobia bacterium]|nr:MAG: hypothetical protein DME66_07885 [Verrucomicrobiota bacterium]
MKEHDLIDFLVVAAGRGASDLRLTVGARPMLRVAGVIEPLTEEPLSAEDTRRLVIDTLKEGQRSKLENDWQLDFALSVTSGAIAEMHAMCQARLRPISDVFLLRSAI